MKKILTLMLLLCAVFAGAQVPTTPNIGLYIPLHNTPLWDNYMNPNFSMLDNFLSGHAVLPRINLGQLGITQYVDYTGTAAPALPAVGFCRMYYDLASNQWTGLNSAGELCSSQNAVGSAGQIGYYAATGRKISPDACSTDGSGHQTCASYNTNGIGTAKIDFPEGTSPGNPAAGFQRIFASSVDHLFHCITHAGASCLSILSGGSINDLQTSDGAGGFAGSDNFKANVSISAPSSWQGTSPLALQVGQALAATNVANADSQFLTFVSNYWNGSASVPDTWFAHSSSRPNGNSNPRSILRWEHTGSSGSSNGSNYNFIIDPQSNLGNCGHDNASGFTTNSVTCLAVLGASTTGSGADIIASNTATSGSQHARIGVQGNVGATFIAVNESDPLLTGAPEYGQNFCIPANCYPYLYINGGSNPVLYLGGFAYGGSSKAALKLTIDTTGGIGPIDRSINPLIPIDFDSGISTYLISGKEVSTPSAPAATLEKTYFKSGSGLCAFDSASIERCVTNISSITPVVQTSQTTAIAPTTVATPSANSTWRVTATLNCDSTSAAATVNITIGWTDPSNTAQTATLGSAVACTALGASSIGSIIVPFRAKSATNITYATTIANTPTYDVTVSAERLSAN